MWVERVEALGFGPLSGAVLELAEGMTLVFGPNEAGKSSWHGALYAGVCGMRRGRGRRPTADEQFELRHRPWEPGPWQVRAVVVLAGGRRFEISHDLSARAGTARDHMTGRDVTSQILTDQTPDASRWLGLERDAFRTVACVPQTALLQILKQPEQLAGHLQRAAATAGTDATAAEAIRRIEDFTAEHVGTDRAYTKPLARAKEELRTAEDALRQSEQAHTDIAHLRQELQEAAQAKEAAQHRLRCAEAAAARRRADAAQDRLKQAADLSARYPQPPPPLADDDALAQRARTVVDAYRSRPAVMVLDGPSATALEAELAELPQPPTGDVRPAAEVVAAYEAVGRARASLESLARLEPAGPAAQKQVPLDTSELRRLADALAEPLPEAPSAGPSPAEDRPADVRTARAGRLAGVTAAAAVILLLAGAAVAVLGRQPLGWAAAAVGLAVGIGLILSVLRARNRQIAALEQLHAAGSARAVREAAERRVTDAQRQAAALGLPADPQALRGLADAADGAKAAAQQRASWEQRRDEAAGQLQEALSQLAEALRSRGAPGTGDPETDFQRYRDGCAQREDQAVKAARRHDLESRLQNRRQAEAQAADAEGRRSSAEQALRAAARACGIPDAESADLGQLAGALEAWLGHRQRDLEQRQRAAGDYAVLQKLLEGTTLEGLKEEAGRLGTAADAAAANLDPADIAAADPGPDPASALQTLRDGAQQADLRLAELRTSVQERTRGVPTVAACQEAVAQAAARVSRLERLGTILTTAKDYLLRAQDSVHHTIAPELAGVIAPHLAAVTGHRYTEVRVDPDDLQVRVRAPSGEWREAALLSHGTAEQIYLLLRAALAQYLATTGEPCPLILDDPTAYADAERTTAVLQVLHSISAQRQVVVFSHDPQVLAWAQHTLAEPRDKIIELAAIPPG